MLKINLLPPYIYERRKVRKAAIGFTLLFVAVVAGMVSWMVMLNNQKQQLTAQVTDMEAKANQVKALQSQAAAIRSSIPTIQAKVQFIEDVMDYNTKMPELLEDLARYTYGRILYNSVKLSGNQLSIQAHARTLGDCGRYLLNMYRADHLFSSVTISGVPGWGGGGGGQATTRLPSGVTVGPTEAQGSAARDATGGFDFTVSCTLINPIMAPSYGGGAAGGTGAAGVGPLGGPGGMPPGTGGAPAGPSNPMSPPPPSGPGGPVINP